MPPKRRKSASSSAGSKGKRKGERIQSPAHVESPGHPDDIFPMVLTSATQELFGCRADEDVTGESPYKLLKKDDIIQDIKTRAAVSDFSPVKQIVLDYPEDELLLVFDRDFTYGQSFYLVLTPEAKDAIFNPPEPETPEVFENEVCKTPEPKPWISLGSEQEIEEESFKETREKLQFKFSRVRRRFGAPVCFSDHSTADAKDNYLECASYQDSRFSIKQMQRDCGMQTVPRLQSSSAQTQWKFQVNAFTQYTPRELSDDEKEKILQSESLKKFCNSVTNRVLQALQQEEITNVVSDDWKAISAGTDEDGDWAGAVPEGLMLYQAFTDQNYAKDKKISSISWHPTIYGVLAVALMEKKEEQLNESTTLGVRTSLILFYSFSDPSNPQLLLESPDHIFAFKFCPSDPNIIVGGCMNGQVVLWDISAHVTHLQGAQPGKKASVNTDTFDLDDNKESKAPVVRYCAVSALESSHKAPITDVHWLPPAFEVTRTGLPVENQHNISAQVVTCSPDCAVLFWDVRVSKVLSQPASDRKQNVDQKTSYSAPDTFKHLDRTWKPLFRVSLPRIDTSGEYAPLKFSLQHYTCKEEAKRNDGSSEVIPDYSQLRVPSAKTLTTLEDVNTQLCIGTEDGEIVYTDWKLEKDDSGRLHSAKPLHCFSIHHRLVNTVQRSPFFKDITLTNGSWNIAIWKDRVMDGPVILSPSSEVACTVACWSPSRPAVFFIGKEDGSIEVWNLLENIGEPAHVYAHVSNAKITCIEPWTVSSKQHFLAVADDLGMVRVFEIPKALYVPSRNESLNMKKFFEVEEERFKDFLKREELWVKQKKEDEELKQSMEHVKPSQVENEEDFKREYNDYQMLEKSILKGLWSDAADTKCC